MKETWGSHGNVYIKPLRPYVRLMTPSHGTSKKTWESIMARSQFTERGPLVRYYSIFDGFSLDIQEYHPPVIPNVRFGVFVHPSKPFTSGDVNGGSNWHRSSRERYDWMSRGYEGSFLNVTYSSSLHGIHSGKLTWLAMENGPFEDVFPIKHVDSPLLF